jgi:hypothetical protein
VWDMFNDVVTLKSRNGVGGARQPGYVTHVVCGLAVVAVDVDKATDPSLTASEVQPQIGWRPTEQDSVVQVSDQSSRMCQ